MNRQTTELPVQYPSLDRAILFGLLATVVFTALAHGTVEPWSLAVFEFLVVGLMALWGVKMIAQKRVTIRIPSAGLPLAAFVLFGVVQSVAFTDRIGERTGLSMDIEATRATVLALFFLVALFLIAANHLDDSERRRTITTFLIIYGVAMALFALVQHFTWNGRLYWFRPLTSEATSPFGPFVNRNHFAGYMELLAPLPIAMVITRAAPRDSQLLYVFAATMMSLSAIVSLSRGGMISLAAEIAFIAIIAAGSGNRSESHTDARSRLKMSRSLRTAALILVVIASISAGIFWAGPERIVDRITGETTSGRAQRAETFFTSRGWIWRETVAMIGANPFLGVGLGAYETAYPVYSADDGSMVLGKALSVDRAHNDYLQVLSDCGLVGGALAAWFIILIFRAVARGKSSHDPLRRALAIGGGAGIFGLLVHSLVDFNLQLPSNALLFLLLSAAVFQAGAKKSAATRADTREDIGGMSFVLNESR
jgi:O-antigen ligase